MKTRKELLEEIFQFQDPSRLDEILAELSAYGWDCETPVIQLDTGIVIAILQRYLRGELTARQVEDWGNAVEMREDIQEGEPGDIEFDEPGAACLAIRDAIHTLANPALEGTLTPQMAHEIVKNLESM